MNAIFPLFVYGSLRSDFEGETHHYIGDYFTLLGLARVRGRLYALPDYPAAIASNEEYYIRGELYTITNPEKFSVAIQQLDDYEETTVQKDGVPLYNREIVDVFINDTIIKSWVYWYNGNVDDKPIIAGGDVLEYLRQIK